jgi:drug/metabolite transporter (DMT)-like permease
MANILFGERLSPTQIAGMGLMLAALSIAMYRRN